MVRANELFDVIEEIPLSPGQLVEVLPYESGISGEALHLHPEEHQEAFLEADIREVILEGDELVFAVELEEPLEGDVKVKAWVMGYRFDTPFEDMPKLFLDLSGADYKVYDHGQQLPADAITVTVSPLRSEVRIPLPLLGDPERVMMSAQTHKEDIPLDNIPWIFLVLLSEN